MADPTDAAVDAVPITLRRQHGAIGSDGADVQLVYWPSPEVGATLQWEYAGFTNYVEAFEVDGMRLARDGKDVLVTRDGTAIRRLHWDAKKRTLRVEELP